MSHGASVIHVTYREGLSSVFPAQVARPMSLLQDRGLDVNLAVFTPLGEYFRKAPRRGWLVRKDQMRGKFGLEMARIPSPPSRARYLWDEATVFRRWLKRHATRSPQSIIHCRGTEAALIAYRATRHRNGMPIIFDCRGLDAPEYLLMNGYGSAEEAPPRIRLEAQHRDHLQRRAAEISAGVICVSEAMKREIQREWSIPPTKVRVIPCCTDVEAGAQALARHRETRARLGFENRLVIAYCGSLAPWQMLPETMEIVRSILQLRPDAHFFAITSNPQGINVVAEQSGIRAERRTVVSVPHGEVPTYLAAADVGLLIRSNSKVNAVASPVKFAEYLATGLPVILTNGIGDYSDLVRQEDVGCVVPGVTAKDATTHAIATFLGELDARSDGIHNQCLTIARKRFDWRHAIEKIRGLYGQVMTRNTTGGNY